MIVNKHELERHCHLSIRVNSSMRQRGHTDTELLLRGTKEQIAAHVADMMLTALGNGEISEIRLVPVAPWDVFDLKERTT